MENITFPTCSQKAKRPRFMKKIRKKISQKFNFSETYFGKQSAEYIPQNVLLIIKVNVELFVNLYRSEKQNFMDDPLPYSLRSKYFESRRDVKLKFLKILAVTYLIMILNPLGCTSLIAKSPEDTQLMRLPRTIVVGLLQHLVDAGIPQVLLYLLGFTLIVVLALLGNYKNTL